MKKIVLTLLLFTVGLTLVGCTEEPEIVEIPNLVGGSYSDAVQWAAEAEINLIIKSEFTDDFEPFAVTYQGIEAGTEVEIDSDLEITYSRGLNPETEIVVPDFSDKTEEDIIDWLSENDIRKYEFIDAFDQDAALGEYLGYEVERLEDRTTTLRKDNFIFTFARGPIDIQTVEFDEPGTVRGVNLGGWFVLEGWMTPDLFNGIEGSDETAFMRQTPNAEEVLQNHWETFITEDDFIWLAEHNINFVRLPIPWWLFGVELAYEGLEYETSYAASVTYIDQAMIWAENHGIQVLLDLHTAPGCQNGFDNGGIAGVQEWGKNESQTGYVATTIDIIDQITAHFIQYDSLWGIQVLNEPAWGVNMQVLQQFYRDSYITIRKHSQTLWVGFHDGFRGYLEETWTDFFTDNPFTNVFFDIHLYHVFGDMWSDFDIHDHLTWVDIEQRKAIQRYDGIVPVVVGEWSLGLQGNVFEGLNADSVDKVRKAFAARQLNVYEEGFGWFFWNYKIDSNGYLEWDMYRLVEYGIFPDDFSTIE
jgi:glucan 1,3-beta-glucosidase